MFHLSRFRAVVITGSDELARLIAGVPSAVAAVSTAILGRAAAYRIADVRHVSTSERRQHEQMRRRFASGTRRNQPPQAAAPR